MVKLVKRDWLFFAVAVVLIAVDRISKLMAGSIEQPIVVIKGILNLELVKNTGASFGMFPGSSFAIALLSIAIICFLLFFYRKLPEAWYLAVASGLLIGGTFGNLIDRLFFGYVVDFISFSFWPAFNFADSGIVSGTLIILAHYVLKRD